MVIKLYLNQKNPIDNQLLETLQEMTKQEKPSSTIVKYCLWLALCHGRGVEYPQGQVTHTSINTGNASKPTDSKLVEPSNSTIDSGESDETEYGIEWDGGLS